MPENNPLLVLGYIELQIVYLSSMKLLIQLNMLFNSVLMKQALN